MGKDSKGQWQLDGRRWEEKIGFGLPNVPCKLIRRLSTHNRESPGAPRFLSRILAPWALFHMCSFAGVVLLGLNAISSSYVRSQAWRSTAAQVPRNMTRFKSKIMGLQMSHVPHESNSRVNFATRCVVFYEWQPNTQ